MNDKQNKIVNEIIKCPFSRAHFKKWFINYLFPWSPLWDNDIIFFFIRLWSIDKNRYIKNSKILEPNTIFDKNVEDWFTEYHILWDEAKNLCYQWNVFKNTEYSKEYYDKASLALAKAYSFSSKGLVVNSKVIVKKRPFKLTKRAIQKQQQKQMPLAKLVFIKKILVEEQRL